MSSIDVTGARAALDVLGGVELDVCDRADLDAVLAQWRRVRAFCDTVEVRIARRARQLAADGRCEPPEGMLAAKGRRSAREARNVAAREAACEQMPGFEAALADGSVSAEHVDALAAATRRLHDEAAAAFAAHQDALLAQAQQESVETFARECRELARNLSADEGESELERQRKQNSVRQWVDKVTGMHHIHAELDPESGAKAWTAINAVTRAMRHDQHANAHAEPHDTAGTEPADDASPSPPAEPGPVPEREARPWDWWAARALVELLTGARSVDRRVPEIAIHIDWPTLLRGLHDQSLCETADGTLLPPSTVRRLCCEVEIFPVVLGGDGEILDQGRSCRLANREQRRALRAMYRTCGHPGCAVPFEQCEIHHVEWWERFGPTDLANLLPLCSAHHHLVHEGGWTLRIGPHRVITLTRPDGTIHFTGSTIDRAPPARPGAPPGRRRTAA